MGTPHAAVPSLERILRDGHEVVAVYTQPDRPAGRGNKLAAPPIKEFALENNLKIFQPTRIKTAEALETFPKGAVNVHFSLLPKYRGAAPVNWAVAGGETKTGVTTMQMDAGLDTGAILLQREKEISEDETAPELMKELSALGADLLSETLAMFDELTAQPQDDTQATFAPIMKKEDGLISWMLAARDIADRARGFQPFPTAFTFYKDKKLTIWKCRPADEAHRLKTVGEVLEAKGDRLLVFCGGDTVLQIEELQIEGKRRMPTRDFLNGVKIAPGEKLG
jgi:methionyl-tRNA formyltransferase